MANASRDQNDVPTLLGALNSNGTTIVPITAEPGTHSLSVNIGGTGTDYGPADAPRDGNFVPVLMGVSQDDGVTPVVIYATPAGKLLIQE
jgi:hypothetical protein